MQRNTNQSILCALNCNGLTSSKTFIKGQCFDSNTWVDGASHKIITGTEMEALSMEDKEPKSTPGPYSFLTSNFDLPAARSKTKLTNSWSDKSLSISDINYSSCYYHHQIGSINLSHYHIFPWLCAWDVCYIIFCQLLHIHSGKTGILFSLLLCRLWWVRISGYVLVCRSYSFVCTLHHLITIIMQTYLQTVNLYNACQICFVECVSKIKHIFSVIHYTIYGAVCFQFTHSLAMIERIYILCLIIIIKSEVWTITHCLGLGHETMVCAVCFSIFL